MKLYTYSTWIIILLAIMLNASCSSEEEEEDYDLLIQDYINQNNLNAQKTNSGLYHVIREPGSSVRPSNTSLVVFDLSGQVLGGPSLGSTFDNLNNITLDLNQEIISGLKESILLLGVGGQGTFILPPSLAFGQGGNGTIPPNSIIIYSIELLGVYEDEAAFSDALLSEYIATENLDAFKTESGLYVVIDEPGNDEHPNSSQNVTVHYEGSLLNGNIFDSSIQRGTPSSFGLSNVIQGWIEGIPYFGVGGKGKLLIPSNLAYGAAGQNTIPGYAPLIFEIELISIN